MYGAATNPCEFAAHSGRVQRSLDEYDGTVRKLLGLGANCGVLVVAAQRGESCAVRTDRVELAVDRLSRGGTKGRVRRHQDRPILKNRFDLETTGSKCNRVSVRAIAFADPDL